MQRLKLQLTGKVRGGTVATSPRVTQVAGMFGLETTNQKEETLFENVEIEIAPAQLLLITGPSGAGKSTLLREIAKQLHLAKQKTLRLSDIPLEKNQALVDCFPCSLEQALAHLSRAGLSEAHLLLRAPAELSEGQSFRYRLAKFFASDADILLADEFCATLDRLTAKVVAFQLQKFIRASQKYAIVATTHEDLQPDLHPTLTLYKPLGQYVEVIKH